ncbi:hypothetical protein [Fuscovulum ytuae]|uniref:Polysaccharide chain length determinant N-terminal domain-containing protein n=1 Tax=Fuscovulum ytuae TaxID=3042299 RepID=A0ABY8Q3H7_9RHOB|nr:hypothetical protein [Fuscovulum sp. YMD61]WGV15403.1 hypothetical protein QF092_14190 [Fuscovulum sp. YMD61]
MANANSSGREDDVVDLSELFLAIWAKSWIIGLCVLLGVGFGFREQPETVFQTRAVFDHFDPITSATVSIGDPVVERLLGFQFVDKVFATIRSDILPELVGESASDSAAAMAAFRDVYRKAIRISRTSAGMIEVLATHPLARAAAELANATARKAMDELTAARVDEASDWMNRATAAIGEASLIRDTALTELSTAIRENADASLIDARRSDLAIARGRHDLLVEAFNIDALLGVSKPVLTLVQEANVPLSPAPKGAPAWAVFGVMGLVFGTLLAGVLGVSSGRIHAARTIGRLASASVEGGQDTGGRVFGTNGQSRDGYAITEPDATEIMVAFRARGSGLAVLVATDAALSSLPAALWMANRASIGGPGATVIAIGLPLPSEASTSVGTAIHGHGTLLVHRQADGTEVQYPSESFDFSLHFREILAQRDKNTAGTTGPMIIACSATWAGTVLRGMDGYVPLVVAVTAPGRTRRSNLEDLRRMVSLDVNILQRA